MNELEISNTKKPYIFRYRPDNENTLSEIENDYIYFPNSEKLNDPFDANCNLINIPNDNHIVDISEKLSKGFNDDTLRQYFDKFRNDDPEGNFQFVKASVHAFFGKFGVACFSISPINIMMWAMYANNHQGICIQYNTELDAPFFDGLRGVNYFENFEKIHYWTGNENEVISNLFFNKLRLWREEYEVRLLKQDFGRHNINRVAVRSISFGLRSTNEYKDKVVDIVKKTGKQIKLLETSLLDDNYGLSFREIIIN